MTGCRLCLTDFPKSGHNELTLLFDPIMKASFFFLSCLLFAMTWTAPLSQVRAEDSLQVIYEEGRAAFYAGQYELAREKLAIVLQKNPNHLPTRAMMAQIEQKIGADNTILRKSYEKIILQHVDFNDVELSEAVQAVRILAKKATQDKVVPNIVIKNPELGKKTVTLKLSAVPLAEVLNYLGQLVGGKVVYDKAAVIFDNP